MIGRMLRPHLSHSHFKVSLLSPLGTRVSAFALEPSEASFDWKPAFCSSHSYPQAVNQGRLDSGVEVKTEIWSRVSVQVQSEGWKQPLAGEQSGTWILGWETENVCTWKYSHLPLLFRHWNQRKTLPFEKPKRSLILRQMTKKTVSKSDGCKDNINFKVHPKLRSAITRKTYVWIRKNTTGFFEP